MLFCVLVVLPFSVCSTVYPSVNGRQQEMGNRWQDGHGGSPGCLGECLCMENNSTIHFLQKANRMQEQIRNKTGLLSKIHHRVTHSDDALWASISLSLLLSLLVLGVYNSKMWQDRTFLSYTDSQPVRYERFNRKCEIPIRHMLRSRANNLNNFFKSRPKKKADSFSMESFLHGEDTVDLSVHQMLLESSFASSSSSSSSSCSSCGSISSDENDEQQAETGEDAGDGCSYRINKYTGEWENGQDAQLLLGGRRRRNLGVNRWKRDITLTSTSLHQQPIALSDLTRVSTSSEDASEANALIRFG